MSISALTPELHDLVSRLLRHTLGSHVELVAYTIANQRPDYLVLLADLARPTLRISIKLAGPNAPYVYPFERTAMLHMLVQTQTTIPMPDIIAVDTSYQQWPWRYLIKTYIPGHEWARVHPHLNPHELHNTYQHFGHAIAQLHTIQFPTFGELTVDGRVQGSMEFVAALTKRAQLSIQSPYLRQVFLEVIERYEHLFTDLSPAHLCHEDLHGHNILVHQEQGEWQIATILDFDKAWAGHHETDLARLELWTGMIGEGFWDAYESLMPVTTSYPQRRPIYQLLWCFEYAAATPQHLADTQQVCHQLGMAPIEHFE